MNFHWTTEANPCPIIEFHDVRTESGRSDAYLSLNDRLAERLAGAGAQDFGRFHVRNHPDRLVLLRGFASMPARREALTAFHASRDWRTDRAEATMLLRDGDVVLTRTITPPAGLSLLRPRQGYQVLISELRFAEQIGSYHLWLRLLLRKAGLDPVAAFATLEAVNDVPAVPLLRNRTHHIALLPLGGKVPDLPPELRNALRFSPEILELEPARALVW